MTGSLNEGWLDHTATLLAGGSVLAVGGKNNGRTCSRSIRVCSHAAATVHICDSLVAAAAVCDQSRAAQDRIAHLYIGRRHAGFHDARRRCNRCAWIWTLDGYGRDPLVSGAPDADVYERPGASLNSVADLARVKLLHPGRGHGEWQCWLDHVGAIQIDTSGGLVLDTLELTLTAAAQGLGVAIGDPRIAKERRESGHSSCRSVRSHKTVWAISSSIPRNAQRSTRFTHLLTS